MNSRTTGRKRKELKLKMATVFSDKINALSPDLRDVLLDDLVTAFESRLTVLNRAMLDLRCMTEIAGRVEFETIQT